MKVAYLVSRFPHLPETFVLREMDEVEQRGIEIVLCPLIRHREQFVHPRARRWLERAFFTPYVSPSIVRAIASYIIRRPGRAISAVVLPIAWMATSPNFLIRTIAILPKCFLLAREMEGRGVRHVHAHFATHATTAAWIIHRLTGIGYSFTAHAHDIYVDRAMLAQKAASARFIVAISEYNRALLSGFSEPEKITVIHCGIDVHHYPLRDGSPGPPFTIVSVASLQPYKGLEMLIRACRHLRNASGDFRCAIAGQGELRPALESLIDQYGLRGHVQLLGPKTEEQVAELLRTAHCFVLPSVITSSGKMDGLPVAIIEALAVGLPVIATTISGIPELVEDGVTGRLVPPGDPAALAAALAEVMHDPITAARWGALGRARVESSFTLQQSGEQMSRLLREACEADPPDHGEPTRSARVRGATTGLPLT